MKSKRGQFSKWWFGEIPYTLLIVREVLNMNRKGMEWHEFYLGMQILSISLVCVAEDWKKEIFWRIQLTIFKIKGGESL